MARDDATTRPADDLPALTPTDPARGLTAVEAAARLAAGLGNRVPDAASRTYRRILFDNAFTPINTIIFAIAAALLLMGLAIDALATAGLVALNIVVAVVQEGRAKRQLDRIALLTRPTARVRRDGAEIAVDPAAVVLGDVVLLGVGDQVVADGRLLPGGRVEIDESLLTGESEPIAHHPGDRVASGSFCVAGAGAYLVEEAGAGALANRLAAGARAYRNVRTPIQREIDLVLRVMVVAILGIAGPVALDVGIRALSLLTEAVDGPFRATLERAYQNYSLEEAVRSTAVVVGLVPQGLLMMLTVAYTVGAVRLAGAGALMQGANAVESLSHVSVLCLDKTGTLTTNRLLLAATHPLAADDATLRAALAAVATNATARNRTLAAIAAGLPRIDAPVVAEVPFSPARRWSAIAFAAPHAGVYLIGAPEAIAPALADGHDLAGPVAAATVKGLRVLLLARAADDARLDPDAPSLPAGLAPLGLVMLADEIQAGVAETLARFRAAGVRPVVISGDHPDTVAALARQAGFGADGDLRACSGADLVALDDVALAREVERIDVFGRIGPDQKVAIVRALQANGHWVAMTGDGVNDVMALKQAQVGIAMQGGSQATRAVADLVLLGDSFAALPPALVEGQRIVRGAQALIELYLARSLALLAMIVGAAVVGGAFPVTPRTNALPALLGAGIPTILLMALIRPGRARTASVRDLLAFSLTAAVTIAPIGLTLYLGYLRATGDVDLARTMLSALLTLCALGCMLFIEPPTRFWVGLRPLAGEWRLGAMVGALAAALIAALAWPWLRDAFELTPVSAADVAVLLVAGSLWVVVARAVWRRELWRRFFTPAAPRG